MENVHLAAEDDIYGGFNDYNPLAESESIFNDPAFQQAVAKTSHGRRTAAGQRPPMTQMGAARLGTAAARMGTAVRGRTAIGTAMRPGTASQARPMTSVRGAGYTSQTNQGVFDPLKVGSVVTPTEAKLEENPEEKCRQLERRVNGLLEESIFASEKGDSKLALDKAKEAGKQERKVVKLREQLNLVEQMNLDLTFTVLFNLAHQYAVSGLLNEAMNTYQVIVKNKTFSNAGRLRVNIGNIYFKKKDYDKAVRQYKMAFDQVPKVQKRARIKIMNDIGVAYIKQGKYEEAKMAFEECMNEKPDYRTGLNLILCAYTLEEAETMKEAFQRLLLIPQDLDEDDKYLTDSKDPQEVLITEVIKNDSLRKWEKQRKQEAERTILTAARIISPAIASTFQEGYGWCVDEIKKSIYADLASDLEINKAIQHLKHKDLNSATEILKSFEKKDSKVASAAANNLSFLYFLQNNYNEAVKYAEQAMHADRYNPGPLVNRGNVFYAQGEFDKARECYREALNTEASCVEALYNLGLTSRRMGRLEEALDCFEKLHAILQSNVQVLFQIGSIYETLEDTTMAMEMYSMAQSLSPTDPGILAKLGELYDREGDKPQAFHYHYESYRYFPSNIEVIKWLGSYYIEAQFAEKAVNYFEKAALIQPNEVKWHLMIASCHRRSGNTQKAWDKYKNIHRKFPENVECLKFLVRLAKDKGLPEATDYENKLKKAERSREIRQQRSSSSSGGAVRSGHLAMSRGESSSSAGRSPSSRGRLSTSSAKSRVNFSGMDDNYPITNKAPIDYSYADPVGPSPERPKTAGLKRQEADDNFDDEELGDDLLPE